jgi:hypothetical protein
MEVRIDITRMIGQHSRERMEVHLTFIAFKDISRGDEASRVWVIKVKAVGSLVKFNLI